MRARMTRAEYDVILATAAATDVQIGAIVVEFRRLGYGEADRAGRLAVTAGLLGLGELGSTRDLVMGDAGRLVRILRGCAGRADLAALLPAEPTPASAPEPGLNLRAAVAGYVTAMADLQIRFPVRG